MKTAALVTCHNIKNYGSVFQTYATTKIFRAHGYEVLVIDYQRPGTDSKGFRETVLRESHLAKKLPFKYIFPWILSFSFNKMESVFGEFLGDRLSLTERTFYTEDELKSEWPEADLYISGSDQIWNSSINGRIERPYFLSFVPDEKKKMSFASSFGKTFLDDLEKRETRDLLSRYDCISTREESGANIVRSLGLNAEAILDPTLWLTASEWGALAESVKTPAHYILVYQLHDNKKMDEYVKNIQKKYNMPCLRIDLYYHYVVKAGRHIVCPTPGQVIELIRKADYVISDSFHMTVFSILFEKKFLAIYSENSYNDRIGNILGWLGLIERHLESYDDYDMLKADISYEDVFEILNSKRSELNGWLQTELDKM